MEECPRAHARTCAVARNAAEAGVTTEAFDAAALAHETESALLGQLAEFPRIVRQAAELREPHRIAFYLGDLAAAFHAFWNLGNDRPDKRIIMTQDEETTAARLYLAAQIGQIIRNGLALMGVEAATSM